MFSPTKWVYPIAQNPMCCLCTFSEWVGMGCFVFLIRQSKAAWRQKVPGWPKMVVNGPQGKDGEDNRTQEIKRDLGCDCSPRAFAPSSSLTSSFTPITTTMNPPTMQAPPHVQPQFYHQIPTAMPSVRAQQQSSLMLAVALAGLGTYAFYNTLGDMQTVIYTVGGAYVLRFLMQNPEIVRQVQARLAALQNGHALQGVAPINSQGMRTARTHNHGQTLPHIDTSFNHPPGNSYQPLSATNGGSGLYDDFENSMATPTTPDPSYTPLPGNTPAASRMQQSRPDSRTSTLQQRGASPSTTVATATPTVRNPPSIGMTTRPGTEVFDPRASVTSTFSAFPIPMTNPFASYQHYDNVTVNGERLLSPIAEDSPADKFPPSQLHFSLSKVAKLTFST